jgi:FkbM family methyltransferase
MIEVNRWFKDKGDEKLRLDYDLNSSSCVFDLGGYKGDFAEMINNKFGCHVHVFEPSKIFYEECTTRFSSNKKITVYNFGLSDTNGAFILTDDQDGSSTLPIIDGNDGQVCEIKRFFDVYKEIQPDDIDLIKINIEGAEYPLLNHIIEKGLHLHIKNIQIQFHNFVENAPKLRENITEKLAATHRRTWCYDFVWENWELKK